MLENFIFTSMQKYFLTYFIFGILLLSFTACSSQPETIKDLSSESYNLVNSDSISVTFPDDYRGKTTLITFIYTHCPDVCPIITANMKNIQSDLADTSNIRFVEITFDPERDRPSVLANYKDLYRLDEQFSLLTGQPAEIDSLLSSLNIVAQKIKADSSTSDSSRYTMMHSNTIYLMDKQGRIRKEYPANIVPPENVIEDLQAIR